VIETVGFSFYINGCSAFSLKEFCSFAKDFFRCFANENANVFSRMKKHAPQLLSMYERSCGAFVVRQLLEK